jgi:hypothetical protein
MDEKNACLFLNTPAFDGGLYSADIALPRWNGVKLPP